ncbi:MAG TPA: DUF177 domain-containing protein [Cyclobacteriaceae bacterium]|nr:DUF177 domain-containing protein [Cyclobacteriaceae bacterium]
MGAYTVNIVGLSTKAHTFDYKIGDEFFAQYGTEILSGGDFDVKVVLDKHETFIDADFSITGNAKLVCDRSLEPFEEPVKLHRKVMFKYGDEPSELTDEIIVIARDQQSLELGQLIYEFISLEIPIKKLHPRFRDEEEEGEGKIVYKSESESKDENEIDPRWEKLKKLK